MKKYIFLFLLLLTLTSTIYSHDIQYKIENKNSVVITINYGGDTSFSFENYEIFSPDSDKIPFQVGRTDKLGRIAFIPDKEGEWEIKAFSSDGHGIKTKINIDKNQLIKEDIDGKGKSFSKIILGIGIILVIFGIISIYSRRKK